MAKHAARYRRLAVSAAAAGLMLLLAGCAGNGPPQGADNGKNNGFYGGINGGWSQP